MFEILLKGIFSLGNAFTGIFMNVINQVLELFPGSQDIYNNVVVFLNYIFTFIPLCLDFLMIPRGAVVFLFDYYIIKYSVYLIIRGLKCALNVYRKLKL